VTVQNPALDNLVQAMRDALEKLERAIQLPSRKDFDSMTERVSELSKRIEALERDGTRKTSKTTKSKK
jgi:polyhydroxyalkanoate synthesis regulator phasin